MDQELEIVINQYRAVGGGNYAMFSAEKSFVRFKSIWRNWLLTI